jgi:hypothetical protein
MSKSSYSFLGIIWIMCAFRYLSAYDDNDDDDDNYVL